MSVVGYKALSSRAAAGLNAEAFHKLSALATLALLVGVFAFGNAAFLSANKGLILLLQTSVIGLLRIGMTIVSEALIPAVKRANDAGIPVAIIDSALGEGAAGTYQAFLSTDNCAAGKLAAKKMIEATGGEGKVAVMSYVAGVGSEIGRVGCFVDEIKASSKIEIVGPFYSQSQMATALNQTTDVLAANPDLKGIFGANEPTAVGMGRAIQQAGKAGQIAAIGFDGNEDLQAFVKDGTLNGTLVQGSLQMGDLGVKAVPDLIAGKTVALQIDTGVIYVTKENLDKPEAKNVLY